MMERKDNGNDHPTTLKWFNSHPVAATLLWALGKVDAYIPNSNIGTLSSLTTSKSTILNQGIRLSENIQWEVQECCADIRDCMNILYSNPECSYDDQHNAPLLLRNDTTKYGIENENSSHTPGRDDLENTASPWGYFVSLSPSPPEEKFPKKDVKLIKK